MNKLGRSSKLYPADRGNFPLAKFPRLRANPLKGFSGGNGWGSL